MEEVIGMLDARETALAGKCLEMALRMGADKVRITLNKSLMELFGTLNGELDKVSHCLDRSMGVSLFANGRFGSFSTNRLSEDELESFLARSLATVRMLAEDGFRDLPDPSRTAKDAVRGTELGLLDESYARLTSEERLRRAMDAAIFKRHEGEDLVSEEGEYSDSIFDSLILDSNGTSCRHTETSFEYGVETTIRDKDGNRYSGYWWDASPFLQNLDSSNCGETALRRSRAQAGPVKVPGGEYTMVVDSEKSSRLVAPVLAALNAYSLQQNNSFLLDTLGERVFPECLTIMDSPRETGRSGSKLFDSEGVATRETPIIEKGVVSEYFVNTYMSRKMGIAPTVEDATRPVLLPCFNGTATDPHHLDRDAMMRLVGEGILVTGFNGGNTNSSTGDFSFGIEGFLFRDGAIVHPVREMLITGNLKELWNNLIAAGNDSRRCMSKVIPTLAFSNVSFSS